MKTGRVGDEHPTFGHVSHVAHGGAVTQCRDRQPEKLSQLDDLGDGPFGHPGTDQFVDEVAILPATDLKTQLWNLLELRTFDHRREVQPLLSGHHRDADVAVFGRDDRRYFQGAANRRDPQQLGMQPFAALHGRDRLEHGQIQMFARATPPDAAPHGQRAERRIHPAHVLAEVATDRDGRPGGIPPKTGATRPGLQRELGSGAVRKWSGPAEVGDRDHDRLRRLRQQLLRIDAQGGGLRTPPGHDHDVGSGEFGAVALGIRRNTQAALAGVEVAEQRRGLAVRTIRHRCIRRRVPPQRIPLRRFHFADLRTGIRQQFPAVAASQAVTDLDHP